METIKLKNYSEIPKGFTGIVEYPNSSKLWYRNGKQHREDGPAREWASGSKEWWLNNERHRVDGPAIEWSDGEKRWFLNGQLHRTDGPAIEYPDGSKEWWLNGKGVYALEPIGEYLLIEEGLSSDVEWLGELVTQRKVLTEKGIMYIPNLPGL